MKRALVPLALLLSLTAGAGAQSLGEVAEKEKQKKKDPNARSFSDDDLGKYREPGAKASPTPRPGRPAPTTSRGQTASPGAGSEERPSDADVNTGTAEPQKRSPVGEAEWRARVAEKRAAVSMAEQALARVQAKIDALRGPQSQPTQSQGLEQDPYRVLTQDPQRQSLEQELAQARADLDKARTELANLEEEARRKGVPPGWLR